LLLLFREKYALFYFSRFTKPKAFNLLKTKMKSEKGKRKEQTCLSHMLCESKAAISFLSSLLTLRLLPNGKFGRGQDCLKNWGSN